MTRTKPDELAVGVTTTGKLFEAIDIVFCRSGSVTRSAARDLKLSAEEVHAKYFDGVAPTQILCFIGSEGKPYNLLPDVALADVVKDALAGGLTTAVEFELIRSEASLNAWVAESCDMKLVEEAMALVGDSTDRPALVVLGVGKTSPLADEASAKMVNPAAAVPDGVYVYVKQWVFRTQGGNYVDPKSGQVH